MENITKFENLNMKNENGNATIIEAHMVNRSAKDEVTGKRTLLGEQFCEITNKKSRYLFTIENASGDQKKVSATIASQAGFSQKQLDKVYTLGYNLENPTSSSASRSKEEVAQDVADFLG